MSELYCACAYRHDPGRDTHTPGGLGAPIDCLNDATQEDGLCDRCRRTRADFGDVDDVTEFEIAGVPGHFAYAKVVP